MLRNNSISNTQLESKQLFYNKDKKKFVFFQSSFVIPLLKNEKVKWEKVKWKKVKSQKIKNLTKSLTTLHTSKQPHNLCPFESIIIYIIEQLSPCGFCCCTLGLY